MLSLLLLTCRRGITWTSLRVCLGSLKCMETDSSMLFSKRLLLFSYHVGTLYDVCSVHQGMFSTSGVFSILGDTMSTLRGYHEYIEGYHEYIEGTS